MLRMRAFAPCIRPRLKSIASVTQPFVRCLNASNAPITPNIHGPSSPPPPPPQYFPQQPLPRYFPQETEKPSASGRSHYVRALLIFLLGALVGHNVYQNPYTEGWMFNFLNLDDELRSGIELYMSERKRILRHAKKNGLGEVKGLPLSTSLPDNLDVEQFNAALATLESQYSGDPEPAAVQDMLRIISQVMQFQDPGRLWSLACWYATDGDYAKFADVAPLVKTYAHGHSAIHADALDLLGEECFAFEMARNIADVVTSHEGELFSASIVTMCLSFAVLVATRKQGFARYASKSLATFLVMDSVFYSWIQRRAERDNDRLAQMMLVTGGYDPKAAITAIQKVEKIQKRDFSSSTNYLPHFVPEFLLPKLSVATRVKYLEENLATAYAHQQEQNKSLEIINKLTRELEEASGRELPKDDKKDGDDSKSE